VLTPRRAAALLIALVAVIAIAAMFIPRVPQPQSYYFFADHRTFFGVANFNDVASNLPFAIVGIFGLIAMLRPNSPIRFIDPRERWAYLLVFGGLLCTAFGSGYFHLAPDNARLVWDRLPIMLVFMALVSAVIAERFDPHAGLWMLPIMLTIGVGSVFQWRASELHGHGDLRFYAAVQIGSILFLLLALLLPSRYTRGSDFGVVVALYVLAKIFEESDRRIFALGHIVSGHTLKHLAAGAAGYWILRMLEKRGTASQ
jgi:hypothetical protein